jgi:molybdopterin synthase sulfur carrier subunit
MTQVTVRYFAGARAAAGIAEEPASAATLDALCAQLAAAHGPQLALVLTACSFLIDGVAARDRSIRLDSASTVDVLPPFAGG